MVYQIGSVAGEPIVGGAQQSEMAQPVTTYRPQDTAQECVCRNG